MTEYDETIGKLTPAYRKIMEDFSKSLKDALAGEDTDWHKMGVRLGKKLAEGMKK